MDTGGCQLLCVVAVVTHNDTSAVYHYTCNTATCKQQSKLTECSFDLATEVFTAGR